MNNYCLVLFCGPVQPAIALLLQHAPGAPLKIRKVVRDTPTLGGVPDLFPHLPVSADLAK